jgi:hypothetical protein
MDITVTGITLAPPSNFTAEEVSACWRSSTVADGPPGRPAIRPNLIVQRRQVDAGSEAGTHVAAIVANLVKHVDGISKVETTEFSFDDGAKGFLLKYTVPGAGAKLAQIEAARLDGDVLTTAVITAALSDDGVVDLAAYLKSLASLKVSR